VLSEVNLHETKVVGLQLVNYGCSHEVMQKEVPGVPILICVNKIDIATREHLDKVVKEARRIFETEEIIEISSKTGANRSVLLSKIEEKLNVPPDFQA
jgi:GTPase Era involved in 16S rRNA processing